VVACESILEYALDELGLKSRKGHSEVQSSRQVSGESASGEPSFLASYIPLVHFQLEPQSPTARFLKASWSVCLEQHYATLSDRPLFAPSSSCPPLPPALLLRSLRLYRAAVQHHPRNLPNAIATARRPRRRQQQQQRARPRLQEQPKPNRTVRRGWKAIGGEGQVGEEPLGAEGAAAVAGQAEEH
jgi:hypothetical protein